MKKYLQANFLLLALLLAAFTGQLPAQSFSTCTGQTVLSISGATTSTITNSTGGSVNIKITVRGGDGGNDLNDGRTGGRAATMIGEFVLTNGETLRAISGNAGGNHNNGGGGGGGAGAVNCGNANDCASGNILIIAAAGSGGCGGNSTNGLGGSAGTSGPGNGGEGFGFASGGGGLNSNGGGGLGGGMVLKTGLSTVGAGGNGGQGMGSGGSAAANLSGGGGGHTGGSYGNNEFASSFNSGTNQNNIDGLTGGGTNTVGSVNVVCLSIALPVELIDFRAAVGQGEIALQWQTASELNNLGYMVQRSSDAQHWQDLGFVDGAGTTLEAQHYLYTDEFPLHGMNYYRLEQKDFDGRTERSPIVIADMGLATKAFSFFPNPASAGTTSLYFPEAPEAEGVLEIFDWLGYKVYYQRLDLEGGPNLLVPVDLSNYAPGIYTARLGLGGEVRAERLVVTRH